MPRRIYGGLGVPIRRIYEGFICLECKIKIGSA